MLSNIDFNDLAILVDFDGTITTEDTNDKMVKIYGNANVNKIKEDFREGKASFPKYFQSEMQEIRLTEDQYIKFLLEKIEISPGFLDFYEKAKERDIPLGIISGGFENGIIPYLKKHGIEDVDIFANKLVFQGNKAHIEFLHGQETMCCPRGPCGNCKIKHYFNYKEKKKNVIFIGDGVTDMPLAEVAEIVFAKDSLADYLDNKEIEYIPYEDFKDINKIIF